MNKKTQVVLPVIVLAISSFIAWQIIENPTTARKQSEAPEIRLSVKAKKILKQNFTPIIHSFGEVQASVSGSLIAEVSGKVEFISPKLKEGSQFSKGDVLAKIDPRFFNAELVVAEGNLASAKFKLDEEIALGQQAETNWKKIGKSNIATDLALRKPHLVAAKAQVKSAEAMLEQARLNLEKTIIKAPYDGKVLKKYLDKGQYVLANTHLADIFAASSLEVRLPISLAQFAFLGNTPESKESDQLTESNLIQIKATLGRVSSEWSAKLVSIEHALDPQTKQLNLIAEIDLSEATNVKANPVNQSSALKKLPLKVGQFVEASLQGMTLENVFVLPRSTVYQNQFVFLADQGRLQKKNVNIIWGNDDVSVIDEGLSDGDHLILTPLGNPVSGTLLSIEEDISDLPVLSSPGTET